METRGPFINMCTSVLLFYVDIVLSIWINFNEHVPSKVWDEISNPFTNFYIADT